MAISATVDWEVRQDGNDLNGGGCVRTNTASNYSLQSAAQKSGADLEIHASTNTDVKPTAAGVAAADVGNVIQISAGTDWTAGFYEIMSIQGDYWRLDRTPSAAGNANLATYRMGGALITLQKAATVPYVPGNHFYIKYSASPYVATAGATFSTSGTHGNNTTICGYDTDRTRFNTDTNRPTIQCDASTTSITLLTLSGQSLRARNLILDGNSQSGVSGLGAHGAYSASEYLRAINCPTNGFNPGELRMCEADNCGTGFSSSNPMYCLARNCSGTGFSTSNASWCLSIGNNLGFSNNAYAGFRNCIAYGNTSDGFRISGLAQQWVVNNISESNGGWGYAVWSYAAPQLFNCAAYNNTSGTHATTFVTHDFITVTAGSVFVDAANGDFRLNNIANRGALLRNAGFPGDFFGLGTGYCDIGLLQHLTRASDLGLTAGILKSGEVVDDVTGTLAAGGTRSIFLPSWIR